MFFSFLGVLFVTVLVFLIVFLVARATLGQ